MSLRDEAGRSGSLAAGQGYITGDMVGQWAYCPRRLYLMYAEGRWAGNVFTDEGEVVHRRVDSGDGTLPQEQEADAGPARRPSVMLDITERRLRVKLDLLETDDEGSCVPVEYKRARAPEGGRMWPPERTQVGFQAMLLRLSGKTCEKAVVYYAASKTRVDLPVDELLLTEVQTAIDGARAVLASETWPAPLVDSPKCVGCSLAGICLPDETLLLESRGTAADIPSSPMEVRRLVPPRDDALPLYVQEQGARVGKRGEQLVVAKGREELAKVRLLDVSQLVLAGNVSISAQALGLLCEAGIPVVHLSMGHWFHGITTGPGLRNAFDRAAQFRVADDETACLALAKEIVRAKASNQRTLLRRNGKSDATVLRELKRAIAQVAQARDVEELLGHEGQAAALYFSAFDTMLRPVRAQPDEAHGFAFEFRARNRRPPKDPINAMLSFGYAVLAKEAAVALLAAGLDPYWGIYHRPRHGRPALALDLMEEFRPLIVDSAVVTAVNTGAVQLSDFERGQNGCALRAGGRKAFLKCYEQRMDQLVTHPVFGYRISWRRVLMVQAMLLARTFRGTVAGYIPITTR